MKNLLILIALLFAPSLHAQQKVINAVITVTNEAGTSFPQTITINGAQRTFTNAFNYPQIQVATGTTRNLAASNLFQSLVMYAVPGSSAGWDGTSNVLMQCYPGFNLNIVLGGTWGSLSLSTNVLAPATVVRVPVANLGPVERTNVSNGLIKILDDPSVTNAVDPTAPAWTAFINASGLLVVSNLALTIGANSTNYSIINMQVSTNYANSILVGFSNLFYNALGSAAYESLAEFQPSNAVLTTLSALWSGGVPATFSYLLPSSVRSTENDIALIQTNSANSANNGNNYDSNGGNSITRLTAFYGGDFLAMFEDGKAFLDGDTAHNVSLKDHTDTIRYQQNAPPGDPSPGDGKTILRGGGGQDAITLTLNGNVNTPGPVTMNTAHWPIVGLGTATNFTSLTNFSTGETTVHEFTIPANTSTNIFDTMHRTIGITFSATGSYEVKVYFAGNLIFDDPVSVASAPAYMRIESDATVNAVNSFTSTTSGTGTSSVLTPASFCQNGSGSPDFTSPVDCKLGVTGPATGNLTVILDNVIVAPSAEWQGVQ